MFDIKMYLAKKNPSGRFVTQKMIVHGLLLLRDIYIHA